MVLIDIRLLLISHKVLKFQAAIVNGLPHLDGGALCNLLLTALLFLFPFHRPPRGLRALNRDIDLSSYHQRLNILLFFFYLNALLLLRGYGVLLFL